MDGQRGFGGGGEEKGSLWKKAGWRGFGGQDLVASDGEIGHGPGLGTLRRILAS